MHAGTESYSIAIIDSHNLRRASILAIVQPWADSLSLKLYSLSPDGISNCNAEPSELKLIIFNVGGSSLHDLAQEQTMASVHARYPGVPGAILSDRSGADEAIIACQSGWKAFVSSNLDPTLVLKAFSFIINGGTYFPLEALLESSSKGDHSHTNGSTADRHAGGDSLTKRQAEVLDRLRGGKSNKLIARELLMQESTVKVHVRQIMRKLGATNRTQAALLAQASHTSIFRDGTKSDDVTIPPDLASRMKNLVGSELNGFAHPSG